MPDMNNKVALITGASSGIGRVTAELFAASGANVVVAARRQDELDSLTTEIEARGGTATAIQTDVSVAADVERMVDHAIKTFGRLDYAVNNAGIEDRFAGIMDLPEEECGLPQVSQAPGEGIRMKPNAGHIFKKEIDRSKACPKSARFGRWIFLIDAVRNPSAFLCLPEFHPATWWC